MGRLPYDIDSLFQTDIPQALNVPDFSGDTPNFQNSFTEGTGDNVFLGSTLASNIGKTVIERFNTGEAINALATPQAVYKDNADGEVYLTDANDTTAKHRQFFGFVLRGQNLASGEVAKVATSGIVEGFTGLTNGQYQYLSDTAGAISETPSATMVVRVAQAITTTELFIINKGIKQITGTVSKGCTNDDQTTTVTLGFRPRLILCFSFVQRGAGGGACTDEGSGCSGAWSDSAGQGHVFAQIGTGNDGGAISGKVAQEKASPVLTITINTITDTGFNVVMNVASGTDTGVFDLFYVAFAE